MGSCLPEGESELACTFLPQSLAVLVHILVSTITPAAANSLDEELLAAYESLEKITVGVMTKYG